MTSIPGSATSNGTAAYRDRLSASLAPGHFRESQGLQLSSIGFGTYLGDANAKTDALYTEAIQEAVKLGCNVIDSAINYRNQRSERAIGAALKGLFESGAARREEIVVATKGGYLSFDGTMPSDPEAYIEETYIKSGIVAADEIVDWNCFAPRYVDDQLARSLKNLGLDCVDIYYLHNSEAQFAKYSRPEFYKRLAQAFELLEKRAAEGKLQFYGMATWNGFRGEPKAPDYLSLEEVIKAAESAGGKGHRFKAIQLPFNLAMPEAVANRNQPCAGETASFLDAARHHGITVMTSVAILQGQLTMRLPDFVGEILTGLATDAQRAIQFVRSAPGIATALVGMKQLAHTRENLATAKVSPASPEDFAKLFNQG